MSVGCELGEPVKGGFSHGGRSERQADRDVGAFREIPWRRQEAGHNRLKAGRRRWKGRCEKVRYALPGLLRDDQGLHVSASVRPQRGVRILPRRRGSLARGRQVRTVQGIR